MNRTKRKLICAGLVLLLLLISAVSFSGANAAEPPSILIIVPGASDDLTISINGVEAQRLDKRMESYFLFYAYDMQTSDEYRLSVSSQDSSFEIVIDQPIQSYNNEYTLNVKNQSITEGKSLSRSIILVSIRLILTLVIEGLLFLLFGYRQKRSWIVFFVVNLLTQGLLNIWINTFGPLGSYIIIVLFFIEILILLFELAAFLLLVKEHRRLRTLLFVLTANIISFIAGGFMITVLPF